MLVIDISYSQTTNIDFVALKNAGVSGVIMKATGSNTGAQYVDSKYRWFLPRVRAAGLLAGHYHFNGYGDPVSDADFFCNNILYQPGDLLALDCESEGSMPYWGPVKAATFHARVGQRMGFVSDSYMSASITKAQNWQPVVNMGSKLWVAQYGTNSGIPEASPNISYWPDWKLWQYTSMAVLPGYAGRLDANTAKSTDWAGGGATPIPTTKKKKKMLGTLIWDNVSQGYFMAPGGGWVRVVSNDDYNVLYRAINADQEKSPFASGANNGVPESFNAAQLAIIQSFVAQSIAVTNPTITDAQVASIANQVANQVNGNNGAGVNVQEAVTAAVTPLLKAQMDQIRGLTYGVK